MAEPDILLRVLRAARETAHAASHLADTAAEHARDAGDGQRDEAATQAALASARAVFHLDDLLRHPRPTSDAIVVAVRAIEAASEALAYARRALATEKAPA